MQRAGTPEHMYALTHATLQSMGIRRVLVHRFPCRSSFGQMQRAGTPEHTSHWHATHATLQSMGTRRVLVHQFPCRSTFGQMQRRSTSEHRTHATHMHRFSTFYFISNINNPFVHSLLVHSLIFILLLLQNFGLT